MEPRSPATLILSEKGEVEPVPMKDGYRLFGTMTPPKGRQDTTSSELSPALYNRFATVFMQDLPHLAEFANAVAGVRSAAQDIADAEKRFRHEIGQVARCLLAESFGADGSAMKQVADICVAVSKSGLPRAKLTFRTFVRFLDSAYLLSSKRNHAFFGGRGPTPQDALWAAYTYNIACLFGDSKSEVEARKQLEARSPPARRRPLARCCAPHTPR